MSGIISVVLYALSVLFALSSLFFAKDTAYHALYYKQKLDGYTLETLEYDFTEKEYGNMNEKIAYNKAINREITEDEKDYYLFADYYEALIDYNVYMKNGEHDKAQMKKEEYELCYSNMKHIFFKERADELRENININ